MNPSNILINALSQRTTWVSASELSLQLGVSKRDLRDLKAASEGHVISSDAGYILTTQAKPEEIRACASRLRAHALSEVRNAEQIERVYAALTQPSLSDITHGSEVPATAQA